MNDELRARVASDLIATGCIMDRTKSKDGTGFRLKSGSLSPVYVNLRRLQSFPESLDHVADLYVEAIKETGVTFDLVAAIPMAAISIVTLISQKLGVPMITPRTDHKDHGSGADIDGEFEPGQRVLSVDDVITNGGSKREALEVLRGAGLICEDLFILVDREQGGAEDMEAAGCRLHSVFTFRELIEIYQGAGTLDPDLATEIRFYLEEEVRYWALGRQILAEQAAAEKEGDSAIA